ncbi:hypothetical protein [Halalkalicoccus subterraneus]|nr:hypothetical protein [Halalkalicoccus subterraneus]
MSRSEYYADRRAERSRLIYTAIGLLVFGLLIALTGILVWHWLG